MIPTLSAISFQKVLGHGSTKPCVLLCENESTNDICEYVVKLINGVRGGTLGLASELMASEIANALQIRIPEAAFIKIDKVFIESINKNEELNNLIQSIGLNFGSKFMTGGYTTWPAAYAIPPNLLNLAVDIFAFDMLIQNVDRRAEKPNLLYKGDELYIIDHELAFAFMYDLEPLKEPWKITSLLNTIEKHIFYKKIKGKKINLDNFLSLLKKLNPAKIIGNIPDEWENLLIDKILKHLEIIIIHADDFIEELKEILS